MEDEVVRNEKKSRLMDAFLVCHFGEISLGVEEI